MIRAKHTIMVPERMILPGELVTLPDGEEPRLIAAGFAVAIEPYPQAEAPWPAVPPTPGTADLPIGSPSAPDPSDPTDPSDPSDQLAPPSAPVPPAPQPAVCKTRRPK